ncbi:MAG: hypothetical protein ACD_17C00297G0001 [uncultured bacterium]|nr:MAG: hypothetical protein ACD_17C00297G0001 [uncultured bacterium]
MRIIHSMGHVVGGTLLIAGTMIGVGMLALPVTTGSAGFLPSVTMYLISWGFMLCTGLLLLEVSLWMPKDTSFISMAEHIFGPIGRYMFWIIYLFFFFTIMVAHAVGGGAVLLDVTGWNVPSGLAIFIYSIVLAPVVYLGAKSVDRLNLFLISGVVVSYFAFIGFAADKIHLDLLQKKLRLAIFFGSAIPLIIYLLWELVILGIIPTEDLIEAERLGQNAVGPLKQLIPQVFNIGKFFAFFALTTSFIPLALSFFDFMADGLKWEKKGLQRAVLTAAIFGIPMIISIAYPHIFLVSLGYAGGIFCAFLFGLMPPLLAWIGRYMKNYSALAPPQLPGGKPLLVLLMLFALFILGAEIVQNIL